MFFFQFFGTTETPPPVFGIEATSSSSFAGIGEILTVVGLSVLGAFVAGLLTYLGLRFWRSKSHLKPFRVMQRTYLITVPKFRREDETREGMSKERLQGAIAASEALFTAIGGLSAQKGIKTWLFGHTDECTFEMIGVKKQVEFYVTVPESLAHFFEQHIAASYPDAHLEEVPGHTIFARGNTHVGSYLKLARESAFPLKTFRELDKDPLDALTGALAKLPEDEGAAFQFVVRSAPASWRNRAVAIAVRMQQGKSLEDAVSGVQKSKFSLADLVFQRKLDATPEKDHRLTPQEEQTLKALQQKASKAGLEVCIRAVVSAKTKESAQTTLSNMLNSFSQFNIYQYGNTFTKSIPRRKRGLIQGYIHRFFDESALLTLNAEEVASLWHLPTPWTETTNIHWLSARRAPVSAAVPNEKTGQIRLGYNIYRGVKNEAWIKGPDRQRHMYLIGKSGSGKTQLIAQMALQDIQAGRGVAIVEPHGDLCEQILGNIPEHRIDDVVYFNPADTERPIGLNMLEARDPSLTDYAVQEMIAIFYKLFPPEMIGPLFEHNMRNVMLTLMSDPTEPGTIVEIPRMFSDDAFQRQWVSKVNDPVVRSFWENEMAKTNDFHKSEMLGYLVSKVGRFVENAMMRNIIGQAKSGFDVRDIMDNQKILLCNLSKGRVGDVNSELLGLIVVSKLQMAALSRADLPEHERKDFYLYIDEFQNFLTDSVATILSEARKYRLNLILAHQYIGQLVKNNDTKIRDAVFGNVGTMMTSRIGPEDVDTLEKVYSPTFSGYDLMNSDRLTWYTKMIVDNAQEKPFTLNFDPAPAGNPELANAIKDLSRLKYGRNRVLVESEIERRAGLATLGQTTRVVSETPPGFG